VEVAGSKRNNNFDATFLDSLITREQVKIIIVFDRLLDPRLLHKWQKVATWRFSHIIVSGDENYSIYAVDSSFGPGSKRNLQANERLLPPGVRMIWAQ